jgi:ABC-2 type transport system permease protein
MRDAWVIFRKEAREMRSDRSAARGTGMQALLLVGLCGVFIPLTQPDVLLSVDGALLVFSVFPTLLAASLAADAFAGERERGTLETLLATPASEAALFAGKTAFAACTGFCASLIAIASALLLVMLRHSAELPAPMVFVPALLGASLSTAVFNAALVAVVSLRVRVARSAQQYGYSISFAITFGASYLLRHALTGLGWEQVAWGDLVALLIAAAVLAVGMFSFRRARLLSGQ